MEILLKVVGPESRPVTRVWRHGDPRRQACVCLDDGFVVAWASRQNDIVCQAAGVEDELSLAGVELERAHVQSVRIDPEAGTAVECRCSCVVPIDTQGITDAFEIELDTVIGQLVVPRVFPDTVEIVTGAGSEAGAGEGGCSIVLDLDDVWLNCGQVYNPSATGDGAITGCRHRTGCVVSASAQDGVVRHSNALIRLDRES